ncbi:MAG TPA: pilus assembly protein [Candidatus Rifleibacterium sp.]|nr:pilus assembly protein [Candidatus Rifleibacterium sp.]
MKRKQTKGQAIVELALFFPFFLLIILGGIIDFGFAFYNYISLQQVANDSAQWAAERNITSFGEISASVYKNIAKLKWQSTSLTIHPLEFPEFKSMGVTETGIKLTLTYNSPVYTPFYQTMLSATLGDPNIPLKTSVTYKIPSIIRKR